MPINLSKGQKVDLTKKNPGLKKIMAGLGWDVNAFDSGADFDLDAAAFMLGANGKCPTEKEFIFTRIMITVGLRMVEASHSTPRIRPRKKVPK